MGKKKYLSAFELGMVVGAKRTSMSVSRTATLLYCSHSRTVSHVYQEWSTTQRTSSQLINSTVGSIGVNMSKHHCGTPSQIKADGKKGVQLIICKVFLMFLTLSVYSPIKGRWASLGLTAEHHISVVFLGVNRKHNAARLLGEHWALQDTALYRGHTVRTKQHSAYTQTQTSNLLEKQTISQRQKTGQPW
jgi:hypothetical protein